MIRVSKIYVQIEVCKNQNQNLIQYFYERKLNLLQ